MLRRIAVRDRGGDAMNISQLKERHHGHEASAREAGRQAAEEEASDQEGLGPRSESRGREREGERSDHGPHPLAKSSKRRAAVTLAGWFECRAAVALAGESVELTAERGCI